MQELQRKLAGKEAEIANLATRLENREREKVNEVSNSNTVITLQDIKELVAQGIKEYQAAMNPQCWGIGAHTQVTTTPFLSPRVTKSQNLKSFIE